MPQCQAFGCKNLRGCLNEKGEKITCFAIPDPAKSKESYEQCRMWIRAIGTDKFNHKKYKYHRDRVVCEQHFTSECFLDDMKARLMGTKPRKRLKPGSVPTIFSFGPNLEPKLPSRSELRIQAKERREVILGSASLTYDWLGRWANILLINLTSPVIHWLMLGYVTL